MTKRSLPLLREEIHLHSFGDASGKGVAAAVYAVVFQLSAVNQGLDDRRNRETSDVVGQTRPRKCAIHRGFCKGSDAIKPPT